MRRVIVLGGLGQFGRTAAQELRRLGVNPLIASRGAGAELRVDANDAASLRATLKKGDVIVDAAGPFHARTTALIDTAIEVGFDVVDLNDDLQYAQNVLENERDIAVAQIRVLSSASSVSAISAAVIQQCGIMAPRRVTAYLAPASRHTANRGTALSLLRSVGRPVQVFRRGRLESRVGWSEASRFSFPAPVGRINGRLFESADAIYLPRIWPTLQQVEMYVDTNTVGVNSLLQLAALADPVRELLQRKLDWGTWLARKLGSSAGGIGYEIEGDNGRLARCAITGGTNSFLVAVAPAVLATKAIALDQFPNRGLVLPDQHATREELLAFLEASGMILSEDI